MKHTWDLVKIGDFGRVVTGKTPPTIRPEYFGGTYPFITPSDIDGTTRHVRTERTVSEDGRKLMKNLLLPAGTPCFVSIGATIGKVCATGVPSFTNQQLNSVVVDTTRHDTRFVYYLLRHAAERIKAVAGGAATPIVNKTAFSEVKVRVPDLVTQSRIGAVLAAYDDLIENNARRIKILEEMARTIYLEWFELEERGRPTGHFGDLVEIVREGISPADYPGEEFEHFSIPAFDLTQSPAIESGEAILSGKYMLDDECVLLSKLNPRIPRVWLAEPSGTRRALCSTEFLVLRPKNVVTREFVYLKCLSSEFAGQFSGLALGTSTSHQRVKPDDLLKMKAMLPSSEEVVEFTESVGPMLRLAHNLRRKIDELGRTRDFLLPRFMSLDVSVEDLDIVGIEGTIRSQAISN